MKFMNGDGEIEENYAIVHSMILRMSCCKRAFLRGLFFMQPVPSVNRRKLTFEIVCTTPEKARQICDMMKTFNIARKMYYPKKVSRCVH